MDKVTDILDDMRQRADSYNRTFKFQKSKLKNAAYHVDEVEDVLFLLARDADGVEPLTADLQAKVDEGAIRL